MHSKQESYQCNKLIEIVPKLIYIQSASLFFSITSFFFVNYYSQHFHRSFV